MTKIIYKNRHKPRNFEDKICIAFTQHLDYLIKTDYKLKGLFYYHIANGGSRNPIEAAKFKRLGVRAGVSDYFVMRASGGYNGLFLEFKFVGNRLEKKYKNKLSENQQVFFEIAERENYKCLVVTSSDEAIKEVYNYLDLITPQ